MKTEPISRIHPAQLTADLLDAKHNAMRLFGRDCRVTLYIGHREQDMFKYAMTDWLDIHQIRHSETKTGEPWYFRGFQVVPVNLPSFYRVGTELEWA